MIQADQPTNTPNTLLIAYSSKEDGPMLKKPDYDPSTVQLNKEKFLQKVHIPVDKMIHQVILYGPEQTYAKIIEVDASSCGHIAYADALYTELSQVALFLPTADCIATTVYDPKRRALALLHLGRHSSIAQLMSKVIELFVTKGSDAKDLHIWMSPSVKKESYTMEFFNEASSSLWQPYYAKNDTGYSVDLPGFTRNLAEMSGVPSTNITESAINTATSNDYYSHSSGDVSGRFATVVMMK